MSAEQNKALVKGAWDAVSNENIDGFLDALHDDVTWTFFGNHRFARTFEGKNDLLNGLFAPLHEVLDGGIKVHMETITAEGDRVIMEMKGEAKSKAGLPYNNDYCIVITCRDGKISAVREYLDTELVTSVFGK